MSVPDDTYQHLYLFSNQRRGSDHETKVLQVLRKPCGHESTSSGHRDKHVHRGGDQSAQLSGKDARRQGPLDPEGPDHIVENHMARRRVPGFRSGRGLPCSALLHAEEVMELWRE